MGCRHDVERANSLVVKDEWCVKRLGFGGVLVTAELRDPTLVNNNDGLLDAAFVPTVVNAGEGHEPIIQGRPLSENATNKTVLSVSQRLEFDGGRRTIFGFSWRP